MPPMPGMPMAGMSLPPGPQPTPPQVPSGDISLETPALEQPTEPTLSAEELREDQIEEEMDVQYKLTDQEKMAVVDHVISLVDNCVSSRAEWEETRKESLELLEGRRPPKSDPWPNCSNIDVMAVATHCKLMHAKLLPTVWNDNLVFWRPVEKADIADTDKVHTFMNWVCRQDMKLGDSVDDIIWDLIINGTVALKTRWVTKYRMVQERDGFGKMEYVEVAYQQCVVDNIPIDELYLPMLWKGEDDSEFIAQDIYMRLPEIKDFADRKIYDGDDIDTKLAPSIDSEIPDSIRQKYKELEGSTDDPMGAHRDSLPIRLIECYVKWPIKGKLVESVFTVAYKSRTYLSGKPLTAVSPIGKRPFVIGQFMRRTGRPYGLSLPEMVRGLAKELNAIHNQRIDAGSISIAPFGFYRAASSFRPEDVQIGPGVMIPVDDIKDVNVIQLQNNPVASFQEERIIIEYMEKLTATSAYQMGRESDIVKSRATATATMAIIGQGEQSFTILGLRCQAIISRLLSQILQQYQMFMPAGYADRIIGEDAGKLLFPAGLSREEIATPHDAYMTLDATAGNKAQERQANAAMIQMGTSLMALAQDPRGYEMAKDFLLSIGKLDVEKYIGKKPQAAKSALPMGPGMGQLMGTEGGAGQPPQGGGGGMF